MTNTLACTKFSCEIKYILYFYIDLPVYSYVNTMLFNYTCFIMSYYLLLCIIFFNLTMTLYTPWPWSFLLIFKWDGFFSHPVKKHWPADFSYLHSGRTPSHYCCVQIHDMILSVAYILWHFPYFYLDLFFPLVPVSFNCSVSFLLQKILLKASLCHTWALQLFYFKFSQGTNWCIPPDRLLSLCTHPQIGAHETSS